MKLKLALICVFAAVTSLSFGQHGPSDNPVDSLDNENEVVLFAPNAFTPDGDYYNDTWKVAISGIDAYDYHLVIFNRAGQIVFESYDPSGEWDGQFGPELAAEGVYPYLIQTGDAVTDKVYQFTGMISVFR